MSILFRPESALKQDESSNRLNAIGVIQTTGASSQPPKSAYTAFFLVEG
ncbi:hypothetical protein N9189_00260 [Pirellulaceae bacterium]|nr:hypothetical protein [Pirellulaceae bacterium]